jgi:anti-sigma factor RsiW
MCPDKQLLSAYCDGEVPSPWKEKITLHLEDCPACRDMVNQYQALGTVLGRAGLSRDYIFAASARVRKKIAAAPAPRLLSWKKRVSLPLTVAAAAALFFFGIGICLSFVVRGTPETKPLPLAENGLRRMENAANIKDMNELLEVLKNRDTGREVTIRLPDMRDNFKSHGQPVFLRAEDLGGGIQQ